MSCGTSPKYIIKTVLGSSVPSTVEGTLPLGGSVGQYLRKTSSADFDATWANIQTTEIAGVTVSATQINHLSGANSNIQTQINARQLTITGAATTIAFDDLTPLRALISDLNGKVSQSSITSTELSRLTGVTSNVQTQLNTRLVGKATSALLQSPTSSENGYAITWDNTNSRFTLGLFATSGGNNNEVQLSNGSGGFKGSKIFSATNGNLTLGDSTMGSGTRTITTASNSTASLYLLTQGDITLNSAGGNDIVLLTNSVERWRINSLGVLRSSGAQTITFGNTGTINTASGTLSLSGSSGMSLTTTAGAINILSAENANINLGYDTGFGRVDAFINTYVPKLFLKDVPTIEPSLNAFNGVLVRNASGEIRRSLRGQKIQFTPTFTTVLPAGTSIGDTVGWYVVNGNLVNIYGRISFTLTNLNASIIELWVSPADISSGNAWPMPSASDFNLFFGECHIIKSTAYSAPPIKSKMTTSGNPGAIRFAAALGGNFHYLDELTFNNLGSTGTYEIRFSLSYVEA